MSSKNLVKDQFGTETKYDFLTISAESPSGETIQADTTNWPTLTYVTFIFSGMNLAEKIDMVNFLVANRGEEVTFVDRFGTSFVGYVTTKILNIQRSINRQCAVYSFRVEMVLS